MTEDVPKISIKLNRLLPITFPMAMSVCRRIVGILSDKLDAGEFDRYEIESDSP